MLNWRLLTHAIFGHKPQRATFEQFRCSCGRRYLREFLGLPGRDYGYRPLDDFTEVQE